jgi:ferrous iron transport protein B
LGTPNSGKTTVFNALCGLRAKTSNFSGTTVEHRVGRSRLGAIAAEVIDLPGLYTLHAATAEERIARDAILGELPGLPKPDAVLIVADASNLERSLFLLSQVLEHDVPAVIALNMMDVAEDHGMQFDVDALRSELACPIVPLVARTGRGLPELRENLGQLGRQCLAGESIVLHPPPACAGCAGCPFQTRYAWSDEVAARCVRSGRVASERWTDRLDTGLTHPVAGLAAFLGIMLAVFYMIFSVASLPMSLIDAMFANLGGWLASRVPEGDMQSLLVDGILGGVGGILVFLPQICILFFLLALLEDSGYLARATFVTDRLLRRVGLPGTAFVPLLSAHACAIPAILATRVIRDPRDRLVTILIAPLMSCSARIPVYAMLTALLFPDSPGKAALLFVGAYALGIIVALLMALLFQRTFLRGESRPLVLELPVYRLPSLRLAFFQMLDRARVFVQQAGSVILVISVVLWALATYPKTPAPEEAIQLRAQVVAEATPEQAAAWGAEADALEQRHALVHSFAGRLGHWIEPAVRPLGFDWQIGIGILSSFAAREVIVSTLAIVYGLGADAGEEEPRGLYETLRQARHADGRPVFTPATSISMLVFYVLAMQCLPTQAVTKRETNSWKWPLFQLAYMTALAYGAAFIAYRLALLLV